MNDIEPEVKTRRETSEAQCMGFMRSRFSTGT